MTVRWLPLHLLLATALLALLAGCGGGGGGGGSDHDAPAETLAAVETTGFSPGSGQRFVASDWGIDPGTQWYRTTDTELDGDDAGEVELRFTKRVAELGVIPGIGVDALLVTKEIHEEDGSLDRTKRSAWAVADNGVVYAWSFDDARWYAWFPAEARVGQRWRHEARDDEWAAVFTSVLEITELGATAPNGRTGCIRYRGEGSGAVLGLQISADADVWLQRGLGTAYWEGEQRATGTFLDLPVDDREHEVTVPIDAPLFAPSGSG